MIKLKSLLIESLINTPAFKKWFGNSKIVDKNGNPLIVYHGTDTTDNFDTFDKKRIGWHDYGYFGEGFYFTKNINLRFTFLSALW